jgi:alcohol dehydrogenase
MVNDFEFNLPVRIAFGAGKLSEAGKLCGEYGRKAMIVCDPFFAQNGLAGTLQKSLEASGIASAVYDKVIPNPTTEIVDAGGEIAKAEGCEFVIGLGGGSSMDTAKGVAVAATHDGPIWGYAIGEKEITAEVLPIVAVSTTSGTGSQCTCFSVITNPETHQKPGMGSPHILPSLAIVDPELMASLPLKQTLITGFDVFCHAVEAYTSKASSPMSDLFAEKAILLFAQNLKKVCDNGANLEARGAMALADTYSGIAICHAVVSLAHVMAHVIGGHYPDIAHGDALFSIYRETLRFNSRGLPEKHKFIANALDSGNDDIVSAFDNFFGQFTFENKLKNRCSSLSELDKLAEDTFTYMKGIVDLNPVEAEVSDAREILVKSLEI